MTDLDWRILVTLYQRKNVTETASLLFMTQPTLTKRLQKIENELGIIVALRNKKGVFFTPEGEYAASQAMKIAEILKETKKGISAITGLIQYIMKLLFCDPHSIISNGDFDTFPISEAFYYDQALPFHGLNSMYQ